MKNKTIDELNIGDILFAVEKNKDTYTTKQLTVCAKNSRYTEISNGKDDMMKPMYRKKLFTYITMVHNHKRYTYKTDEPDKTQFCLISNNSNTHKYAECFTQYEDAINFIQDKLNEEYKHIQTEINKLNAQANKIKTQLDKYKT